MLYEQLLTELRQNAEPEYAAFHKRLLKDDKINVMGVRVPTLKKIAKKYKNLVPTLLSFPDDYYEVTFVKLQAAALLPYNFFINYVDKCVPLIDNWATCDSFAPKCIASHKDDFWKYINNFMLTGGEFAQRFALTTLLHFYVDKEWLDVIYASVLEYVDLDLYYVHMAAAWLIAEVLVKYYDEGVKYLQLNELDIKTHNKAIQKACESYRLTNQQKEYLKSLKRKI